MSEEAVIFIGNKSPMRYVTAMITAFNQENVGSITLKARGRTISRAVDVAEITRNRFIDSLEEPNITIDTEQLPAMNGGTRGVSTIAISFQLPLGREPLEREPPQRRDEAPEPESTKIDTQEYKEKANTTQYVIADVKGIGKATNEKLDKAGVDSVEVLASYDPETLSEKTGISAKICVKLIEAAKDLIS